MRSLLLFVVGVCVGAILTQSGAPRIAGLAD